MTLTFYNIQWIFGPEVNLTLKRSKSNLSFWFKLKFLPLSYNETVL